MSGPTRSKPYQFKPPPFLSGDTSLHLNFSLELRSTKRNLQPGKRLHINLSQVEEVDALGLASVAANLAKTLIAHPEFEYQIRPPEDRLAAKMFVDLRFETLLLNFGMKPQSHHDLWSVNQEDSGPVAPWSANTPDGTQALIFIPSVEETDRETTLDFARNALQEFYEANPSRSINFGQVHQILHEILKNSIDHSLNQAVLAMKIEDIGIDQKLTFLHCELGIGIVKTVRAYLGQAATQEHLTLSQKGDISALLHWAFNPGNSSRPESSVNAGLGLSTIRAAAKGGGIRVSLFDAQSAVYINKLPKSFSHGAIRKALYSVHPPPCFMYMGHTTCRSDI
jgi:hypothetical protein